MSINACVVTFTASCMNLLFRLESACLIAKRTSIQYNDIVTYLSKWVKEHKVAKRTISQMKPASVTDNWNSFMFDNSTSTGWFKKTEKGNFYSFEDTIKTYEIQ